MMEILIAGVLAAQLAVKRAYEEGLRLDLALEGYGDVGVSLRFEKNRSFDAFMGAEAEMMDSNTTFGAWDRDSSPTRRPGRNSVTTIRPHRAAHS